MIDFKKYMKSKVIKAIKQSGAILRSLYHDGDKQDAWLVEYDRDTRLCVSVGDAIEGRDYTSDAWSCDCPCFLSIGENMVKVYSLALDNPAEYETALVLDNFEQFVIYVKRFLSDSTSNIYSYLKDVYIGIAESRKSCNYTQKSSLEVFCDVMNHEVGENYPEVIKSFADSAMNGQTYNNHEVIPNIDIVRYFVLPRFFDILVMLDSMSDSEDVIIQRLQESHIKVLDSVFYPEIAVIHLSAITLRASKHQDPIRIFDPFVWGIRVLLEVVRIIRKKTDVEIIAKGYSLSKYPEKVIQTLFSEYRVQIKIDKEISLVNEWMDNCDIVLCLPPYRTLNKLISRCNLPVDENQNYTVENFPFVMIERCLNSLTESGVCLIDVPCHSLKDEAYKTYREKINELISIRELEYLGSYINKESYGPRCAIIATHKSNEFKNIICRWNEDKVYGFDESIRENIKNGARVAPLNDDLLSYQIPSSELSIEDWSPLPFSKSSIVRSLRGELQKNGSPIVRVDKIFNIRSGIRTGFLRAFLITGEDYNCLDQNQKTFFYPLVNSQSLRDGQLKVDKFLFYPYQGSENRIKSERELSRKLPQFYKYLCSNKFNIERYRSAALKSNWWELVYRTPSHDPGMPKIVSLATGSKGVFALDADGSYVVNSACQWVLKKGKNNEDNLLLAYLAIFSSDYFWKLIDIYAEKLFSGYDKRWRLNINTLRSVPIPDLTECPDVINVLSSFGQEISEYGCSNIGKELDDIVTRLYDGTY